MTAGRCINVVFGWDDALAKVVTSPQCIRVVIIAHMPTRNQELRKLKQIGLNLDAILMLWLENRSEPFTNIP